MTLQPSEPNQSSGGPPQSPIAAINLPPPPGRGPSREYRASVTFTIASGAILIGLLLVSGAVLQTAPPIRGVLAIAGVLLGLVVMFGTVYGLAHGRGWAVGVATPMLLLLLVAGVIETVVALTRSSINIPIGSLLALWALRAPIRTRAGQSGGSPAWGPAGALAFGGMLVSMGFPIVSPLLLQDGGPFIVAAGSFQPSLKLTCPGTPAAAPTTATVTYDWRWSRAEPWAAGIDTITLAVYVDRTEESAGYTIDSTTRGSTGTWQSDLMIFDPQGVVFGVDLAQAGFAPGSVGFGLESSGEGASAHGSIDIQATYRHAPADTRGQSPAIWQVVTQARCEW